MKKEADEGAYHHPVSSLRRPEEEEEEAIRQEHRPSFLEQIKRGKLQVQDQCISSSLDEKEEWLIDEWTFTEFHNVLEWIRAITTTTTTSLSSVDGTALSVTSDAASGFTDRNVLQSLALERAPRQTQRHRSHSEICHLFQTRQRLPNLQRISLFHWEEEEKEKEETRVGFPKDKKTTTDTSSSLLDVVSNFLQCHSTLQEVRWCATTVPPSIAMALGTIPRLQSLTLFVEDPVTSLVPLLFRRPVVVNDDDDNNDKAPSCSASESTVASSSSPSSTIVPVKEVVTTITTPLSWLLLQRLTLSVFDEEYPYCSSPVQELLQFLAHRETCRQTGASLQDLRLILKMKHHHHHPRPYSNQMTTENQNQQEDDEEVNSTNLLTVFTRDVANLIQENQSLKRLGIALSLQQQPPPPPEVQPRSRIRRRIPLLRRQTVVIVAEDDSNTTTTTTAGTTTTATSPSPPLPTLVDGIWLKLIHALSSNASLQGLYFQVSMTSSCDPRLLQLASNQHGHHPPTYMPCRAVQEAMVQLLQHYNFTLGHLSPPFSRSGGSSSSSRGEQDNSIPQEQPQHHHHHHQYPNTISFLLPEIDYYLRLNALGRRRIVGRENGSGKSCTVAVVIMTPKEWVHLLGQCTNDLDWLYFVLTRNPTLCAIQDHSFDLSE